MAERNPTLLKLRELVKMYSEFSIRASIVQNREAWSDDARFTVIGRKESKGVRTSSEVEVRGFIRNGHTSERAESSYEGKTHWKYIGDAYRPTSGYWGAIREELRHAVRALPLAEEPYFVVYLDGGTNQLVTEHGIHVDFLRLGTWEGVTSCMNGVRFDIDTFVGYHNSARFGSPRSDVDRMGSGD